MKWEQLEPLKNFTQPVYLYEVDGKYWFRGIYGNWICRVGFHSRHPKAEDVAFLFIQDDRQLIRPDGADYVLWDGDQVIYDIEHAQHWGNGAYMAACEPKKGEGKTAGLWFNSFLDAKQAVEDIKELLGPQVETIILNDKEIDKHTLNDKYDTNFIITKTGEVVIKQGDSSLILSPEVIEYLYKVTHP